MPVGKSTLVAKVGVVASGGGSVEQDGDGVAAEVRHS
jgi:ABC-type cobalamin transport system ATPase subunit